MLFITLLISNLLFAQDLSIDALKAENERLKKENYELSVQVGLLESNLMQTQMKLEEGPPVLIEKVEVPVKVHIYRVNRLSVLTGSQSNRNGLLGGVQYQRMLNSRVSFGGQVQTNDTVLLNLGLEF